MSRVEAGQQNIDTLMINAMDARVQMDELMGPTKYSFAPDIAPSPVAGMEPVNSPRKNRRLGLRGTLAAGMAINLAALTPGIVLGQEPTEESPAPSPIASLAPETALNPEDCPTDETLVAAQPGTGDVNFGPSPSEAPDAQTAQVSGEISVELDEEANTDNSATDGEITVETDTDPELIASDADLPTDPECATNTDLDPAPTPKPELKDIDKLITGKHQKRSVKGVAKEILETFEGDEKAINAFKSARYYTPEEIIPKCLRAKGASKEGSCAEVAWSIIQTYATLRDEKYYDLSDKWLDAILTDRNMSSSVYEKFLLKGYREIREFYSYLYQ